jgi:methyl-accepting chemotaxis protein
MRTQASRHRSNLHDHLLTADPKIKQATDKLLDARMEDFTRAVKLYQPLISTDEERNLARELQTAWKDYIASVNEVLDYSRKGDNEMAIATNASTTIDLGRRTDALMGQLVEPNYKGAEADGARAQATYTPSPSGS